MSRLMKYISLFVVVELLLCLGNITPVQAASLTLSSDSGNVGDSVTINGSGFTAYEDVYITYEGNSANDVTVSATSTGKISKSFKIPSSVEGQHTITAEGETVTADAIFTVESSITLSKTSGDIGSSLTITGYGFGSSETGITITFNSLQVGSAVKASTLGYFSTTITIPTLTAGTYTLTARGDSNNSDSSNFTINVNAKISISKTSGPAGTSVTVSGTGFAPNESGVTVTLGGKVVGTPTSANSTGGWSITFTTTNMAGGSYNIDAYGNSTLTSQVSDLSFRVDPTVTLSPTSGAAGATISVDGNGFYANESVTISYDSTDIQTGIKADSDGSWSGKFTVPTGSSGTHKVYARGTTTVKTPTAGIEFKLGASLSINKTSGEAGTIVTVTGAGFAAKETNIVIIFDGSTKTEITGNASDAGSWTSNYTIPATFGGEHKIDAEGKTTKADSIPEVYFTVLPEISIDKTEGTPGTPVTVSAHGFTPKETGITITYDGKPLGGKIIADASGAWKTTVVIPASPSGQHTLLVNGSATDTTSKGSFSFDVTSTLNLTPTDGFVGSVVTVSGTGFAPNSNLRVLYDGVEMSVGLVSSDSFGNVNKTVTIPKSVGGSHVIRVQDNQSNFVEAVFEMDSTPPPAPRMESPEDSLKMGLFGNITPSLEWAKVTDPSGVTYNLQLDTDPEFGEPLIDVVDTTATKYTVKKANALPRGEYYWRVQAVDGASNASDWSGPWLLVSGKISPVIFFLIIFAIVIVLGVGAFFLIRILRNRKKADQPQTSPEIVIPEVVNAEYKQIEGDKKALPWRLALPQAPQPARGAKSNFSEEDQARLKVIIDFAKSVPLAEPGANTNWLVDLAENTTGLSASPALYSQLVKGELQLRYEPAWMRHPTYLDLQTLLEGQPLLQDLNTFIDTVNRTAADAEAALGDIYQEIVTEVRWDIFTNGGWKYISGIYIDSFNWYNGKYLKEPAERDYSFKAETLVSGEEGFGVYAEPSTPFAGLLIQVSDEQSAQNFRALHLKLRRNFRSNERIKVVVTSVIQLEVQRNRLVNAFRQFNRLTPS
jgi:hypothetical protein